MLSTVEEACLPVLTLHARTETENVNSSQKVIEQVLKEVISLKRIILGKGSAEKSDHEPTFTC